MKMLILTVFLVSQSALAIDMNKMADQAKGKAQDVMGACKDDKVKFCDKVTEMTAIKECLMKNKEGLTAGCKAALGLK